MDRPITAFEVDAEGHWCAVLACGHRQHTRHDPPLVERPWVLTPEGRAARVGTSLDCRRCDEHEMPADYTARESTPTFTERSVPAALLRAHTTRRGVWALIHVVSGRLEFVQPAPHGERRVLAPGMPGVVLPEVEHHVACPEPVRFYVEFWRSDPGGD